ncbi:hypothetical protein C8R45DRAFT_1070163 [Mycena sanguinolenta]|nr:hypothetical protein C8R45DRAFT_1070163 [Mycena sanguinolenta]
MPFTEFSSLVDFLSDHDGRHERKDGGPGSREMLTARKRSSGSASRVGLKCASVLAAEVDVASARPRHALDIPSAEISAILVLGSPAPPGDRHRPRCCGCGCEARRRSTLGVDAVTEEPLIEVRDVIECIAGLAAEHVVHEQDSGSSRTIAAAVRMCLASFGMQGLRYVAYMKSENILVPLLGRPGLWLCGVELG